MRFCRCAAEEAVRGVRDEVDWEVYDLNNDGVVDRFVLHTTKGQEEKLQAQRNEFAVYTLRNRCRCLVASPSSTTPWRVCKPVPCVGTIVHEMLHQMGAVDLYPVHDEIGGQSWKGSRGLGHHEQAATGTVEDGGLQCQRQPTWN